MTDKLTISVELGAVIPVGDPKSFANVKPLLRIEGIDPSGDVDAQVSLALGAASKAWAAIDDNIEVAVSNIIGNELGNKSLTDQVKEIKAALNKFVNSLETVKTNQSTLHKEVLKLKSGGDNDSKAESS